MSKSTGRDDSALQGEGDRYLIEAIQRGDADAFVQLVDAFSGRLRAYAARRLGGTGIDPEDAVQETLLGFLQSVDRIETVRTLQAYLFQILRNKIVDLTRRRPEAHGLKQIPLATRDSNDEVHGFEPVSPAATPSSYVARDETSMVRNVVLVDVLDEYICELKTEQSFRDLKVLELLFYRSWKNRDIAAEVGVSEPTVTRVKAAALGKLARLVARHPRMSESPDILDTGDEDQDQQDGLIRTAWSANLLSCLKRSTLGAHALGALEGEWRDYAAFHLDVVGCEYCAANLADLKGPDDVFAPETRERIFASSVGFLRKLKKE
jgi:RNA polymerase sigma factor (sigma-70 family)